MCSRPETHTQAVCPSPFPESCFWCTMIWAQLPTYNINHIILSTSAFSKNIIKTACGGSPKVVFKYLFYISKHHNTTQGYQKGHLLPHHRPKSFHCSQILCLSSVTWRLERKQEPEQLRVKWSWQTELCEHRQRWAFCDPGVQSMSPLALLGKEKN